MPVLFDWSGGSAATCKLIVEVIDANGDPSKAFFSLSLQAVSSSEKIATQRILDFFTDAEDGTAEVMLVPGPVYQLTSKTFGSVTIPVATEGLAEINLASIVAGLLGGVPAAGRCTVYATLLGANGEPMADERFTVLPTELPAVSSDTKIINSAPVAKLTDVGGQVWFRLAVGVAHRIVSGVLGSLEVKPQDTTSINMQDLL